MSDTVVKEIEAKGILTKSSLPVGGYSANPYTGCTHGCRYCYASFMKRFTGHTEEWGSFLDVKTWPEIADPHKYKGQRIVIGSVTDGYLPQEEKFERTRKLLMELKNSDADILICTKSDLVLRDIDILKEMKNITVSWSVNTLDEDFRKDMDNAVSIERRLHAMEVLHDAGIRTVCFVSPVFPGLTDIQGIFNRTKDICDLFWLENLNLRGSFRQDILSYVKNRYPHLYPLYEDIYIRKDRSFFRELEDDIRSMAAACKCPFTDNILPAGRSEPGHPVIVNYFFHEEIRGSENTGKGPNKEKEAERVSTKTLKCTLNV